MKTSVVLFAVLVFNVQALKLNFTSEYEPKLTQIGRECAETRNVDFKHLPRLFHIDNYPTHEELNCTMLCMIKKFNALDDDNRYRIEILKNFFSDPILQDSAEKAVKRCLPEDQKINSCKDAYDLYQCFLNKTPHHFVYLVTLEIFGKRLTRSQEAVVKNTNAGPPNRHQILL
ncbi:PREDICTED: uncharacterized protein LOC108569409 [Nicrophorus vespilloides]|uniref:Uncharacterized protein LOC108569409 n=1 Tax=Nicrophorus vespilloides TaxID=110193 RepID=A0ABM1NHY9_NICVS|nr:PREDICTED: uncharacterized protein LOC108569409 [Nicrophorus vespilloides]